MLFKTIISTVSVWLLSILFPHNPRFIMIYINGTSCLELKYTLLLLLNHVEL